jgi:extracellular elastinolytic metalloproteinase
MERGVVVMSRRPRWLRLLVVLGVVALVAAIASPASGGSSQVGDPRLQGDPKAVGDLDARTGRKAPSAQQRAVARGKTVRWNRFGTPQVLTGDGDYLATGLASDPVAAARSWLAGNTALLGVDRSALADLELLVSAPIGKGRAVLFQQRFGGLPAGHDGLVVVGVVAGKVAYVSSSLAGGDLAGAASLSSTEAFRRAAASAGRSVGAVTRLGEADGWTILRADGFASPQRIRLVALPIPGAGAVPAYEAIVLDGAAAEPLGVSVFVDARSGAVLLQERLVDDEGEPS